LRETLPKAEEDLVARTEELESGPRNERRKGNDSKSDTKSKQTQKIIINKIIINKIEIGKMVNEDNYRNKNNQYNKQ
jgi:hypothetical protein